MKKTNNKTINKISKLAIFSGSLLVAASAVLTFAPVFRSNAAEQSVDVNVTVNPIISISLDKSTLNFNITPTSAGVFDSGSIVATVDTNSTGGYELYFSSEDSDTSLTSLVSESTIASDFNNAVTSSAMAANKWGYSLDATNFNKIPALADQAKIKNLDHIPSSSEKDTTVTIGTKIDSSLPSGAYSKKVVFSAIAHPSLVPTLHTITSMQEMTSEICTNTTTPVRTATALDWDGSYHNDTSRVPRKSLQDTRDGKYYLVSKLADGNCWMSQNLELELDSTEPLLNTTTDLNSKTSWTPENSTLTTVPNYNTWPSSNSIASAAAHSYYPIATDRYYQGGTEKSSTPTAAGAEYDWEKAGIYYNWFAATAGSGTYEMSEATASDSICPKGWRLPASSNESKSWNSLLSGAYSAGPSTVIAAPFNFIRAGRYVHYHSAMEEQGDGGQFWTWNMSTATSGSTTVESFNDVNVSLTNANTGFGFNVRCVAR
jgi:uncharacterized protein (TIGR02145 family)